MEEVVALLEQLTSTNWLDRRKVVTQLAQAGDRAIPGLAAVLSSKRDNETRLASAVEALVASTGHVDGVVLALIGPDTPPGLLCDTVAVLGRRRSKRAIATLERLTVHPDGNVALSAIEALGRIGGGAGVLALISLIQTRDFFRTFPAIEVLGKSRDPRAASLLAELLSDPLYMMPAARALGDSSEHTAIAPLFQALLHGDDSLVSAASVALCNIAGSHRERFLQFLRNCEPDKRDRAAILAREAWTRADPHERASLAALLGWLGGEASVEALLAILAEDDSVTVSTVDALRTLGRLADAAVLRIVANGSSHQRRMLLPLLGGAPGGVEPVIACLKDPDPAVRAAAADALGRLGKTGAVDALYDALTDLDTSVVQAAIAAIQSLGSAQTEVRALAAANGSDAKVRRSALRIIAYFGYPSGLDSLVRGAADPDDKIRDASLSGLPFIDDPRAKLALLAATRHEAPQTRAVAIRAVAQLRLDSEVEAALALRLDDTDAWVRYFACLTAGRLGANGLLTAIIQRLSDTAGQVRVAAIEALSHLRGDGAQAALEAAAKSDDPDVRRAAIVGLGAVGGDDAVKALLSHAGSSDVASRLMALASLANYDGPQVVRALRRAAFDTEWTVRQSALALLAGRTDPASTQTLIDLIDQRQLLELVLQALASQEKHIPHLLAALETASAERSASLASVLARFRRQDADHALIAALLLPNVLARRAAATALGVLGSPEVRDALRRAAHDDPDPEVRERAQTSVASK